MIKTLELTKDKKYKNKIIRNPVNNMLKCMFITKEEIEIFKEIHNIRFKQRNLDTLERIEKENQRISSVLNLRERLHDTYLSKEYCEILGIKNAKVVIIESYFNKEGKYREGTIVHISKNHSEIGNSIENISTIMDIFENPKNDIKIFISNRENLIYQRYIFIKRYDEKKLYYALVDKKSDKFDFFDIYFKKNKEYKKEIEKNIIKEINELIFDLN